MKVVEVLGGLAGKMGTKWCCGEPESVNVIHRAGLLEVSGGLDSVLKTPAHFIMSQLDKEYQF